MDPVAVANLALGWLGCDRVTSFESPTQKTEQLLADQFEGLRDAVLEDGDWTFATKRFVVVPDPTAVPPFGYAAAFPVDATVLRVVSVAPAGNTGTLDAFAASLDPDFDSAIDWRYEDRCILADAYSSLYVKAIRQVPDSMKWSPAFCQALAARIAADLCVPLTADRSLMAAMWTLYEAKLKAARSNDGRQGRSQVIRASTIARRRW
jgi:hypothetical protein